MRRSRLVLLTLALAQSLFGKTGPVVVFSHSLPEPPITVNAVATDDAGNAYVAQGGVYAGGAYVSKVNATEKIWTVRIGGSASPTNGGYLDSAFSIAVDTAGNIYVAGNTAATDFPIVNGPQKRLAGDWDAFLAKLSPGGVLLYSTYLGGSGRELASSVAVDQAGNVYLTGNTSSPDFPTVSPVQANLRDQADAFAVKINAVGQIVYATYLGGSGNFDIGRGIATDQAGNAYITGWTNSTDFPIAQAAQSASGGGACRIGGSAVCPDTFVVKLDPSGAPVYSTYLGGSGDDRGSAIAVDAAGNAYVTGTTASGDFPTRNPLQPAHGAGNCPPGWNCTDDAFVAKFDAAGRLVYSTYLGGASGETATGIAVDASGRAYVAGGTSSRDFPLALPFDSEFCATCLRNPPFGFDPNVCGDAFLAQLNAEGSALLFSTYLDCVSCDTNLSLALDPSGDLFLAGGGGVEIVTAQFVALIDFAGMPVIAPDGILNAASFLPGPVAPGEIITMSGTGLGPILPAKLPWDASGQRVSLGGIRVLFDGVPAPLIEVDANHIRAVVPYSVAGSSNTHVSVESAGTPSDPVSQPVTTAAPGIFTWNLLYGSPGLGFDRAFLYNADGQQNTPRHPASRGSVVLLYATGEGQTNPAGVDGRLALDIFPEPLLPVSLRIGGQAAEIVYAGAAPGFIAGLMEIHARVPDELSPADTVPIEIMIGGLTSQAGLNISVQ